MRVARRQQTQAGRWRKAGGLSSCGCALHTCIKPDARRQQTQAGRKAGLSLLDAPYPHFTKPTVETYTLDP